MNSRGKPEAIALAIDAQQFELAISSMVEKIINEKLAVRFERLRQEIDAKLIAHQRGLREIKQEPTKQEPTNQAAQDMAMVHMPGAMIDIKVVAKFLGCSRSTVRSWVRTGKLAQPITFSRNMIRWRSEDIVAYARQLGARDV